MVYSGTDTLDLTWDFGDGCTWTGTYNVNTTTYTCGTTTGCGVETCTSIENPVHTYIDGDPTNYTVTLTAQEQNPPTDSASTNLNVTIQNTPPTVTESFPAATVEGMSTTLTGQFSDPAGANDNDYTVVWDFGDGTAPVTVSGVAYADRDLSISHTWADDGDCPDVGGLHICDVSITVTDADGDSNQVTETIQVVNVTPSPSIDTATPISGNEGFALTLAISMTDGGADDQDIEFEWGDGCVWTGSYNFSTDTYSCDAVGAGCRVGETCTDIENPVHVYADDAFYPLTLTVTDDEGDSGTTNGGVTINDVTPSVTAGPSVTTPVTWEEGELLDFTMETDAGSLDDLIQTIEWDFGEGAGFAQTQDFSPAGIATFTDTPSYTYADQGTYTVSVRICDEEAPANCLTDNSLSVDVLNVAPVLTLTPPAAIDEGESVTLTGSFTDPGDTSDTYSVTVDWGNGFNGTCGVTRTGLGTFDISCGPYTYLDSPVGGSYTITVTVDDGDLGTDVETTTIDVNDVAPVISAGAATQTINEGSTLTFSGYQFTNANGSNDGAYACTWVFGDGTPNEVINPCSYTGDPTTIQDVQHIYVDDTGGPYTATLTVTDNDGTSDSLTVTVTVDNVAPTVDAGGDQTVAEGSVVSFNGSFTDPGTADTHDIEWDFEDDASVDATGSLTPNNIFDEGTYTTRLTVTDDDTGTDDDTLVVTVTDVDAVIDTIDISPVSPNEGQLVTFTITAESGATADPTLDQLAQIDIDFGDGTNDTLAVAASPATAVFTHTYDDEGTGSYTVTITVTDEDGPTVDTRTVVVNNLPPVVEAGAPLSVDEGTPLSFAGGSFTDDGVNDTPWGYQWSFGDTLVGPVGSVAVQGPIPAESHTYANDGVLTAQLTVTDVDGDSGLDTVEVTINNIAPTIVSVVTNSPVGEGQTLNVQVTATDPGPTDQANLRYSFDWFDDGLNAADGDIINTPLSTASFVYPNQGNPTLRVHVYDDDTSVSTTVNVTINDIPPTITEVFNTGPINEGSCVTAVVLTTNAAGDTLDYSFDWNGDGDYDDTNEAPGPSGVREQCYDDDITLSINVRVRDDDGGEAADATTLVVNNVSPTIDAITHDGPIDEGGTVNIIVTASDDGGTNDPLTYSFDLNSDGDFTDAGEVANGASNTIAVPVPTSGTFNVRVQVDDDDGGNVLDMTSYVVNNLPPTATAPTTQTGPEGSLLTFAVTGASDPGGDPLTYNWDFDGDGVFEIVNGSANESHTYMNDGTLTGTVRVMDDDGGSLSLNFDAIVTNVAPVVNVATNSPVNEGTAISVTVSATDPGDDTLLYSFDWEGDGLDAAAGDILASPLNNATFVYPDAGTFTLVVSVADDDASTDQNTTITINDVAPVITEVFNTGPIDEAGCATVVVMTQNAGNDTLDYSFDWDNDGLYDQPDETPTSNSVRSKCFGDNGTYPVVVRVRDDDGGELTQTTNVEVNNVAPRITSITDNGPVDEGTSITITVAATDPAGTDDPLTYSYDLDGDGDFMGTGDVQNSTDAFVTFNAPTSGTFDVGVRVEDDDGGSTIRLTNYTANNLPPTATAPVAQNGTEGTSLTFAVTGASDPGNDPISYAWDFNGDGMYEIMNGSASESYVYMDDGTITGTVRVSDDDGGFVDLNFDAVVTNVAPTLSVRTSSPVSEGSAVTVEAMASDPGSDTLLYSFDWNGDGQFTLPGDTVDSLSPVAYHTYLQSGTYTITVRADDQDGGVITDTAQVLVTSVGITVFATNDTPVDEGSSVTISITASGNGPFLYSYDWNGDTVFSATDGDDVDSTSAQSTRLFSDDIEVRVFVRVFDQGTNETRVTDSRVVVENVTPVFTSNPPLTALEGAVYTYTATTTDPAGIHDPRTYTLLMGPAGMTIDPATGDLTWTPMLADVGNVNVSIRAVDGDGGVVTQSWTVVVAFVDSNNNGLPDSWELLYGVGDPNADDDGDGISNLDEYLAGTNPTAYDGPSVVQLLSPIEGEETDPVPTLTVGNAVDPTGDTLTYRFRIWDSSNTSGTPIIEVDGIAQGQGSTIFAVTSSLTDNMEFWWTASAFDGNAFGGEARPEPFFVNVANDPPTAPTIFSPDQTSVAETMPTLTIGNASDLDRDLLTYVFEVFDNAGMTGTAVATSGPVDPLNTQISTWAIDIALTEDATYYWRATATDEHGLAGPPSAAGEFTIDMRNLPPSTPTINAPADGEIVGTTQPTVVVNNSTDPDSTGLEYYFELDATPTFNSSVVVRSGAVAEGTGTTSFEITALTEDTTYYWRARASDGVSMSDWVLASFKVNAQNAAPNVPVIIAPADGTLVDELAPSFVVLSTGDKDGDSVTITAEVFSDADLTQKVGTLTLTADGLTVSGKVTEALVRGQTYYWRAKASDGTADSEWSNVAIFHVYLIPEIPEDSGCSCDATGQEDSNALWALMFLALPLLRRRR